MRDPLERRPQLDRSIRPVETGLDHWSGPVQRKLKKIERPPSGCPQLDRSVRPVSLNLTRPLDHWTGSVRSRGNLKKIERPDHWITGLVRSGPEEIEKKN